MSIVTQAVIVLVLGAIGWAGGLAVTDSPVAAIGGAVGGAILGLAFCDWLRSRFRALEDRDGPGKGVRNRFPPGQGPA